MLGPLAHPLPRRPDPGDQDRPLVPPPDAAKSRHRLPGALEIIAQNTLRLTFYIFLASHPLVSEATGRTEAAHEEPDTGTHTRAVQSTESEIKGKHVHGQGHGRPTSPHGLPGRDTTEDPSHKRTAASPPCQKGWGSLEMWRLQVVLTHTEHHC